MSERRARPGRGAVDLIVSVVLVGIVFLFLFVALPRNRERARGASCRKNLMQIGVALGLYHHAEDRLPTVLLEGESPIAAMLARFGVVDFESLDERKVVPKKPDFFRVAEHRIRGLICPSDPKATSSLHPAPTSYRATTGDDAQGRGGPFEPGRVVTFAQIEAADGAAYTAAFSERFVGSGTTVADLGAYALAPGPITDAGCPANDSLERRGDAGSTWTAANWRSTLYNHSAPPNARLSCLATDGRSARMGTSSGHPDGVHVLLLDGSVQTYRTSVAPQIWKALATTGVPNP